MDTSEPTPIPWSVKQALSEALKNAPLDLARAMWFLADAISKGVGQVYMSALKPFVDEKQVFNSIAQRFADDTKTADNDSSFLQCMQDIWSMFLKDCLDPKALGKAVRKVTGYIDPCQWIFLEGISYLPVVTFSALHGMVQAIKGTVSMCMKGTLTKASKIAPKVVVPLVATYLAYEIIWNISEWWMGKISGAQCVANILGRGVGVAGGLVGSLSGEWGGALLGMAVAGPPGAAVGAVFGAVTGGAGGAYAATAIFNLLIESVFCIGQGTASGNESSQQKEKALSKAYAFLGVKPNASNTDVNEAFRKKGLIHHPHQGGQKEDWTKLQYYMAIIRQERGEA